VCGMAYGSVMDSSIWFCFNFVFISWHGSWDFVMDRIAVSSESDEGENTVMTSGAVLADDG
jgi:hypothetical protein